MATFNLNDFLSDDIPECLLQSSKFVRSVLQEITPEDSEIQDINLIGVAYNKTLLHEWHSTVKKGEELMFFRLPVYLPKDEKKSIEEMKKHSLAGLNISQILSYSAGDYLIINDTIPCQLVQEKDGTLTIKRIELFASQKQIQDFLEQTLHFNLVTAAMVIIKMHSLCYKGLGDIGWLLNLDGTPSLLEMDRRSINKGLIFIDGYDELLKDTVFSINSQYYIVDEDNENGQFIAKISAKEAKAIAHATSAK